MVTTEQARLIRESLPAIRELSGPIAALFYGRLFELAPEVRPLFKQDIAVQGRKLMDMLTALIAHVDGFGAMAPALKAMGQRHAGYGVRFANYEPVAAAFVWALGASLEGDLSNEAKAAWRALVDDVSAAMLDGAAELPPG